MRRRAPQEGRSYEQALYSVVLLVPRLPRAERTGTVRVLLDFIADLWELDRSRVDAHAHTRTDTHIRGRTAARPP